MLRSGHDETKMIRALAIVVLLSGCGASGLAIANGTALGVSTAALACDWGQTRAAAGTGWPNEMRDANPIIGPRPTPSTVDVYFIAVIAANIGIWFVTPRRYRMFLPALVSLRETKSIVNNNDVRQVDLSACGARSL